MTKVFDALSTWQAQLVFGIILCALGVGNIATGAVLVGITSFMFALVTFTTSLTAYYFPRQEPIVTDISGMSDEEIGKKIRQSMEEYGRQHGKRSKK